MTAAALTRRDLYARVESRLRILVADQLGVDVEELRPTVSLRDDLALDGVDLLALALLVEREFRVAVSGHVIDDVRSYGDLADATVALIVARTRARRRGLSRFWARRRVSHDGAAV